MYMSSGVLVGEEHPAPSGYVPESARLTVNNQGKRGEGRPRRKEAEKKKEESKKERSRKEEGGKKEEESKKEKERRE